MKMDGLSEELYKDKAWIMQFLRENLILWRSNILTARWRWTVHLIVPSITISLGLEQIFPFLKQYLSFRIIDPLYIKYWLQFL